MGKHAWRPGSVDGPSSGHCSAARAIRQNKALRCRFRDMCGKLRQVLCHELHEWCEAKCAGLMHLRRLLIVAHVVLPPAVFLLWAGPVLLPDDPNWALIAILGGTAARPACSPRATARRTTPTRWRMRRRGRWWRGWSTKARSDAKAQSAKGAKDCPGVQGLLLRLFATERQVLYHRG